MPFRSRKRRRYGKKKIGKRRGKKYSNKLRKSKPKRRYKRRYGKRSKVSKLNKNALSVATKYTTIYKTAVRVTSKTGTCNFVSLSQDKEQVKFKSSAPNKTDSFKGDMSFFGLADIQEALRSVQRDYMQRDQGELPGTANFIDAALNETETTAAMGVDAGKWATTLDFINQPDNQVYCGKHSYQLVVKSAITGANCSVTLYKVKARYNLPNVSWLESGRTTSAYTVASAGWAAASTNYASGINMRNYLVDVNSLLNNLWANKMGSSNIIGNPTTADHWSGHQEGTTLYDNTEFCKLFKIVKTYNFELLPGQSANLKLKNKYIKKLNAINMALQKSYLCSKGQVFFIMKLQGAVGHAAQNNVQENKFFGGLEARPNIGLMPAAVDVMCMKKLNVWISNVKKNPKIRNIIKVADYEDDKNTEALGPGTFRDCAPSDYNDSAAIIY